MAVQKYRAGAAAYFLLKKFTHSFLVDRRPSMKDITGHLLGTATRLLYIFYCGLRVWNPDL